MYSLTREASQHIDAYLPRHLHVPLELLMENAGRGIADALVDVEGNRFHEDPFTGMVLFVCGVGNNGADGLVAARHLMEQGIPVSIALVGDESHGSELFNKQLTMVQAMQIDIVPFESFNDWSRVHVVVEGLMGTGFQGELREPVISVLHDIDVERNQHGFSLWAIDVPAGVDATTGQASDYTLFYDTTVTFGSIKEGLLLYPGKSLAGTVIIAPLGVPWELALGSEAPFNTSHYVLYDRLASLELSDRMPQSHKGVNGNVLIIGGSTSMIGAPIMSGEAAVQSGAGKVSLAVPQNVQSIVQSKCIPEVMVLPIEEKNSINLETYDVVAIGPGLGRTAESKELVNSILEQQVGHMVIDADGLYALGTIGHVYTHDDKSITYEADMLFKDCIMTPHLGEFSRLIDKSISYIEKHYVELAIQFATAHNVVLVLKGIPSLVAFPTGEIYINGQGNSGMGTGGIGDSLTGIITSFVAQGYSLQSSALLGVYVHSRSADILCEEKPWGYTPSDVSRNVGVVLQELLKG